MNKIIKPFVSIGIALILMLLNIAFAATTDNEYDVLFENITTVTLHEEPYVIPNSYVGIKDKKIVYFSQTKPTGTASKQYDGKNKVLMPGLINTHTHIPMSVLRGYADGYELQTWLNEHIFPIEAKLNARAVKAGAMLGIAEAIASGTTSISDLYFFEDSVAQAVAITGINANLSYSTTDFTDNYDFETNSQAVEARKLAEDWHEYDAGRIKIDAAIHGEYTSHKKLWLAMAKYAKDNNLGLHVHISETKSEHEGSKARNNGLTPTQALNDAGVFDVPVNAAHGVYITEEDMDIMSSKKASLAHNPVSNLKLASGFAPVLKAIEKGINVSLGTDGAASNNSHDMFEEIKTAALIHKATSLDPTVLTAADVLKMATINGAKAQGRNDTGKIEVGTYADLIVLDFNKLHLVPCYDVLSHLVYAARGSDVCLTMVRGKILYEDGRFTTVDIEAVKNEIIEYVLPLIKG